MNFVTSRASAIEKLNNFVEQNLFEYSKLRNFDYGPNNRSNISCLSPYITHGVISELEIIKKSLNKSISLKTSNFTEFFELKFCISFATSPYCKLKKSISCNLNKSMKFSKDNDFCSAY